MPKRKKKKEEERKAGKDVKRTEKESLYSEKVKGIANFNRHNLTGIQFQNQMLASCLSLLFN